MQKNNNHPLIACNDCDLLFRMHTLQDGERAVCPRCGSVVHQKKPHSLDQTIIYSLTALILFVLANLFPFLSFQLQGREQVTFLISGSIELYQQGFWELALLVIALGVVFPLFRILGTLYVLIPLKFNRKIWKAKETFRLVKALTPWAMMEVFMLGVIVAYVKLVDWATVVFGISFYSFAALIVFMSITATVLNPDEIWERLERAQ